MTQTIKPAGRLVAVRHGETDWNARRIMTGQADVPLNDTGREQARCAGLAVTHMVFDKVYVSPLVRTRETAHLLLEASGSNGHLSDGNGGWRLEVRAEVIERHAGIATGLPHDDPRVMPLPQIMHTRPEGGESVRDVIDRVGAFFDDCIKAELESGMTVLIVAHAGVLRAIRHVTGTATDDDFGRNRIPNATPEVYDYSADKGFLPIPLEQTRPQNTKAKENRPHP